MGGVCGEDVCVRGVGVCWHLRVVAGLWDWGCSRTEGAGGKCLPIQQGKGAVGALRAEGSSMARPETQGPVPVPMRVEWPEDAAQ